MAAQVGLCQIWFEIPKTTFTRVEAHFILFLFTVPKDEEDYVDTKAMATFPGYELLSYREKKVFCFSKKYTFLNLFMLKWTCPSLSFGRVQIKKLKFYSIFR